MKPKLNPNDFTHWRELHNRKLQAQDSRELLVAALLIVGFLVLLYFTQP